MRVHAAVAPRVLRVWWTAPAATALGIAALYLLWAFAIPHGPAVVPDAPVQPTVLDPLAHWDGGWYTRIATVGYATGTAQTSAAFFPLLPILMAIGHTVIPFLSVWAVALAVNLAALAVAACLIDRALIEWSRWQRLGAIALLLTLPSAFFYVCVYTEALFLLGMALLLWGTAAPGRLMWAALGVAMASADRAVGAFFLLPLAAAAWQQLGEHPRAFVRVIGVGLAGVATNVAVFAAALGQPFGFVLSRVGWSTDSFAYLGFGASAAVIASSVTHPSWDPHTIAVLEFVPLVAALVLLSRRNLSMGIACSAAALAGPVTGGIGGVSRYMLVLAPAWITAAGALRRWRFGWTLVAAAAMVGFAVNLILFDRFIRWAWAG